MHFMSAVVNVSLHHHRILNKLLFKKKKYFFLFVLSERWSLFFVFGLGQHPPDSDRISLALVVAAGSKALLCHRVPVVSSSPDVGA